jgi:Planctomycete extracellular
VTLVHSMRSWLNKVAPKQDSKRRRAPARRRLAVEGLEDRFVLSSTAALAPPALGAALAAPAPHQATTMLPLTITGVSIQNGQLLALGQLGSTTFSAPLSLTTSPSADPACPILHLRLNAIHLNLLGLKVDTSNICLNITAMPGSGNLLGNLLCNVAHLLDTGTPLSNILGSLSSADVSTLTGGLTSLLNGALATATAPSAVSGASTNILHLSLGPVDLNLLGLDVHLDNCANGPVTVDISAQSGPGQLLGNLLRGLGHLLDSSANQIAIGNKLAKVANEILSLL